ncbi:MAG: pyridoxamine 5'-phosphate oxidase family protein [Bacteroidota bacterium]|nr:pyridoxamine 5'-phosphate oxidase family protein [Bacteroidota bacterium]
MTLQDCMLFANENPLCFLATAEGDQPRVRALGFWFADETGFYFQTAAVKEFPHQLEQNPKTEVCFYKHDGMIGTMLRIAGTVEFVDTKALRDKVFFDRPFLKNMGVSEDSHILVLFRIAHGQAHFWTMENNLKPKEFIQF